MIEVRTSEYILHLEQFVMQSAIAVLLCIVFIAVLLHNSQ